MVKKDNFEKKWMIIFTVSYFLIMLPLPFYFNNEYVPGWFGVPNFVYGWLIHGAIVILLIAIYAYQCLQRSEYQDDTNNNLGEENE